MLPVISRLQQIVSGEGRTANVSRQAIYTFALKIISVVVGLIYVPLLFDYLDKEKYGVWLTLISVLHWFALFDIGLGNGLRNKLTESIARNNIKLARTYVSTAYALLIIIFTLLMQIFHIINYRLDWSAILNTKSIDNKELYLLTSIVSTFFIIRFIVQLIGVIYLAYQKPFVNSFITTLGSIISLLLVYLLIYISDKGNIVLLGTIVSIVPVLLYIVLTIISFRTKYFAIRPSYKYINFKHSKDLLILGGRFFIVQITVILVYSTSNILITHLFNPVEVIRYNIAYKYFSIPIMVYGIILVPIWSAVTDAYAKSDFSWLKRTLRRLNILSVLFVIGIIMMALISNYVYHIWLGTRIFIPMQLSIAMAFYVIINVSLAPYSIYINGLGKVKLTSSLSIVGIILYFTSSILLSKLIHSSICVVLGMSIASIIGLIIQPIQAYKILNNKAIGIWSR